MIVALLVIVLAAATAAATAWTRCPSGAAFSNADCRDILNTPPGLTLAQCEANCTGLAECTAFNIGGGGCAMRACAVGTEPTAKMGGFVGWANYPLTCPKVPPQPPKPPPPPPPPQVKYGFRWATTHSDGMVLQAAPQHSIVWGFAEPGTIAVRVCIDGGTCVEAVLEQGPPDSAGTQVFTAILPQMPPSAIAYSITATPLPERGAPITLNNVVWGDVYVCSGQSNMDFATPMAFNASVEDYDYSDIRLFTVQKCRGGSPHNCVRRGSGPALEFLNSSFQKWVPANKTTVYGATPWTSDDYSGWEAKIGQVAGGKGFSGACWYFGRELYKRRKYPIGLIWSSIGGTPDEVWMPPAAFAACGERPRSADGWDLMTAPLLKNVIAGVIWYQGESNSHSPLGYNCTFPALIDAWRAEWFNATNGHTAKKFPFGFVQLSVHGGLPCYGAKSCYNQPTWGQGYAAIRWAQTASVGTVPNAALENVFMATAVDLGEPRTPAGGPHVRDKQSVGSRLALAFREQFIPGDGPFFTPGAIATSAIAGNASAAAAGGSMVTITLSNLPPVEAPLLVPWSTLGLEVSDSPPASRLTGNDTWVNVTAVSLGSGKGSLQVSSSLARITQVRYLWSDNACMGWNSTTQRRETSTQYRCPLVTSTGLPVLPFVLDVVSEKHT